MEKGIKTVEEVITKVSVRVVETLPMDITDGQNIAIQEIVEEYLRGKLRQTSNGVSCALPAGFDRDERVRRDAEGLMIEIAAAYFPLTPNGRALKKEIENLLDMECK